jgi:hypothetical protein
MLKCLHPGGTSPLGGDYIHTWDLTRIGKGSFGCGCHPARQYTHREE